MDCIDTLLSVCQSFFASHTVTNISVHESLMNYLISGISGLIGSRLSQKLRSAGHSVFSISRDFKIVNQTNFETAKENLSKIPEYFDTFFHCASAHPSISTDDVEIIRGNITFTKDLLKHLAGIQIESVIFCSSVAIFGQCRKSELDVDSPIIMPSLYGRVKLETEKYITDWSAQKNTKIHIVRLPAVIGQNGHGTFLVKLITAIKNGEALTINSKKSRFNHAVYLDDVCAFMKALSCDCKYSTLSILGATCPLTLGDIVSLVHQRLCILESNVEETDVISNIINTRPAELLGFKSMKTREIIIKQIQLLGI